MPFTRLKKRKLWTKYIVNLKKVMRRVAITLTTLSAKKWESLSFFFWNQPSNWDVFLFQVAVMAHSSTRQILPPPSPGVLTCTSTWGSITSNSVEKSTCHHWVMREQREPLGFSTPDMVGELSLFCGFHEKLWIGSVREVKLFLFSLSKHQSIYWESQRKPCHYPCLLSTLHINTSMKQT